MTGPEECDDGGLGYIPPSWKREPLPQPKSAEDAAKAAYERLKDKNERHDDFGSSDDTIDEVVN